MSTEILNKDFCASVETSFLNTTNKTACCSNGLLMGLYKHRNSLIICFILLLGICLRFYRLGYQSLWVDEVVTYMSSNGSLTYVISQSKVNSNVPPLYYLFVNGILRFGNHDALLRLPSVIFGSLSILMCYLVIRNWLGRTTGFIAALMMAISPFHIWYSQEARPYTMLIFLSLLSLWFLQKLIKNETDVWLKIGFIISTAATFYCHTVGIAFIGVIAVYVLLLIPREKLGKWIPVFAGILLLITPAIYRLIVVPPEASADPYRTFSFLTIPYTIWAFGTGYSLGPTLAELHMPDRMNIVSFHAYTIFPILFFLFLLFLLGVFHLLKRDKLLFLLTMLWFLVPILFVVFGSILTSHPFNVRYAILSFPAFIAFLSAGTQNVGSKWFKAGIFFSLILISLLSLGNYFFNQRYQKENIRNAGQFLRAHANPNQLLICSAAYTEQTLRYYYGKNDLIIMPYPEDFARVNPIHLRSDLKKITAGRDHFWLFLSRIYSSDPKGYIRNYCETYFERRTAFTSNGVELILYDNLTNKTS